MCMSLIDDQTHRFAKQRGMGAAFVRWKIHNYHAGQASLCAARGDMEGYAYHRAIADAARDGTLSLASGPPIAIADRQPDPPESTE